jgi:hypothetical protein
MRDWDKALAKVDQAMAKQANAPATGKPTAVSSPASSSTGGSGGVYTWLRLSLALVLGIAMTQWPYVKGCGFPLFAYIGAAVTLIAASIWTLISSWRSRSTVAHFVSIGLLFWGFGLSAREILPRVGYAKQSANWMCAQPGQPNPPTPVP